MSFRFNGRIKIDHVEGQSITIFKSNDLEFVKGGMKGNALLFPLLQTMQPETKYVSSEIRDLEADTVTNYTYEEVSNF